MLKAATADRVIGESYRGHMRLAFLPLALVETYLRSQARWGRNVLRAPSEMAPLMHVCRIAAANWFGRI